MEIMTNLAEIRTKVAEIPREDRAELVAFLLGGLNDTHHWLDDEEVIRRSEEFEAAVEKGLTQEEFLKASGRS